MPIAWRDTLWVLAAGLIGVIGFLVFAGWTPLLPTNIAWLDSGDRAMHQLGWMFFRDSPWTIPPGLSPRLGIELSNSIALVDGLPLFALPFKLLAPWLPQPFQYFGYWLLLCFILQAIFAFLLARQLGAGKLASLVAAGFALATPAFLFRVPMHMALSGHWVIIAALWLYVANSPPRRFAWSLLAGITASIHATLLAMVLALWFAALLQRLLLRRLRWRDAAVEFGLVIVVTLTVMWAVGFLVTGDLGTYGFGLYKLNLLGPLIAYNWSALFPAIPHTEYDYEGTSFLGIGIFALLALALFSGAIFRLGAIIHRRWWPLALMLLLLIVFAISPKPAFADHELLTVQLPRFLLAIGSAFRSSGRFVWPLLYLITIGAAALLSRRFRPLTVAILAVLGLGAQLYDSAAAWQRFGQHLAPPASQWETPLTSPFWDRAAAAGYNRVRIIPAEQLSSQWEPLSYYAVTHHMDVDAVYLGRMDSRALARLMIKEERALANGVFEPQTLYVLQVRPALEMVRWAGPDDLLALIDGRIVFARGGAHLVDGLGIQPHARIAD